MHSENLIKEAIILAGGFGSRLKPVVDDIPKPMASVNDSPFLEYILNYLLKQKVSHVVLSVGYKYEMIKSYFGSQYENINLDYAVEVEPRGTGGGIKLACEEVKSEDIIVINGDTLFPVDLDSMMQFHHDQNADITIAVKRMRDFDRYGVVEFDEKTSFVEAFKEKKYMDEGYINGGVYILNRHIFDERDLPEKFSFEKDILENKMNDLRIVAYTKSADNYFIDIGIPEDYQKAQHELERDTN